MKKIENTTLEGLHGKPIVADVLYEKDKAANAPILIFAHGFKGFKDWGPFPLMAEAFAKAGYVLVKFNFSHNGGTVEQPIDFPDPEAFGQNNISREMDDLKVVIDAVQGGTLLPEGIGDVERIGLFGHSRGGGTCILKAAEDDRVKRLITWSAISDLMQRVPTSDIEQWRKDGVVYIPNSRTGQDLPMYYQVYEDLLANRERFDISRAARKLHIPWLIVHGENDETVPLQEAYSLKEWSHKASLKVLKDTGHTFDGAHPHEGKDLPASMKKAVDLSVEFLREHEEEVKA